MWFDWWIAQPAVQPYLQQFAAFYYNRGAEWSKGVAINYKKHGGESFPDTAGVLDIERGQLAGIRPLFWQTDTSVSKNSWGYVDGQDYKTVDSIVDDLVDIVSKNGALLLNIGPKPDGTIPEPEQQMLREIGQWLRVQRRGHLRHAALDGVRRRADGGGRRAVRRHEAAGLHAARHPLHHEGQDALRDRAGVAAERHATVTSLAKGARNAPGEISDVSLLGSSAKVTWTRDGSGLHVTLPADAPSEYAAALRIALQ